MPSDRRGQLSRRPRQAHLKPLERMQLQFGRMAGFSSSELCRLFGCTTDTVWRHTTKLGITATDDPASQQQSLAIILDQLEADLGGTLDKPIRRAFVELACTRLNERYAADAQQRRKLEAIEHLLSLQPSGDARSDDI